MTRPISADTGALDYRQANQQARLADSLAERYYELIERLRERPTSRANLDQLDDLRHDRTYARAVRDTLLWLTGGEPAEQLCTTLDLPHVTKEW